MFTCEKVVEVLENIGVTEQQILKWERYYGLDVPHDRSGKKYYDEKHIKAFKQIKKYIALGYKEEEIKEKLIKQINSPVLWEKSILVSMTMEIDYYLEVGVKNVLAGLNKRIVPNLTTENVEAIF